MRRLLIPHSGSTGAVIAQLILSIQNSMQVALSDPHKAVTFVSYSCSGAVTSQVTDQVQAKMI